MRPILKSTCALAALWPAAAHANSLDASLSGLVGNSCILSLTNNGTLASSTDGTMLASDISGGTAAVVAVVMTGTPAQISFSAPTLFASPAGWSASHTTAIRYTSAPGGANVAYTSAASSYTPTSLLDTLTIHGKITAASGFAAGTYTVRTTLTCS